MTSPWEDSTPTTPLVSRAIRPSAAENIVTAARSEPGSTRRARPSATDGRRRPPTPRPSLGPVRGLLAALVGAVAAALLLPGAQTVDEAPLPGEGTAVATALASPVAVDPRTFPVGGCIALPARASPARAVVMVDAGHGGPDPGSLGTTADGRRVAEKELTLSTSLAVASRLRERGVTVVLSRSTDGLGSSIGSDGPQTGALTTAESQRDLLGRVRCANQARADALVSIHFNSFENPAVRGSETLYDVDRSHAPRSRALAQSLQSNIRAGLAALNRPAPDRGVIDDSAGGESGGGNLVLLGPRIPGYVDEPSAMPGALVEPLFLTNPDDLTAVASPRGVDALSESITRGVEDYLDGGHRR